MPPKRKRSSNGPEQRSEARNKPYAYLKPQVRQVSETTIKSKWSTLPEPVQDRVRDMFRALERPVIVRQQNEGKRIEAQAAVQAVVKNLGKRLPRMPFPPVTKDSVFEYEAALKEHCSLEATLATVTDSIDLLKAEVEKEEAMLEREKKQLQEMERNAKRAEAERKRQSKNLENDPEVSNILKQLTGHLKSMQNNTAPVAGLKDAIGRSHAALSLTFMPED
ncbi:kinetochore protein Fta7 [Aspergillus luchuensis]|uniref:Kinetochore protein Fta7 n=1 Tax=Aspergillus kawachii TaxID=1069201 RepID=A0A146FLB6_ASPKA|nr:kinetochore protein Fta7 [Aspergillus luchuensis]